MTQLYTAPAPIDTEGVNCYADIDNTMLVAVIKYKHFGYQVTHYVNAQAVKTLPIWKSYTAAEYYALALFIEGLREGLIY